MMLFITFLVVLFPVALAFPTHDFVESDANCADALVACKNIESAQSCKAVQPCVQIWEKLKVPEDNNEICDLCKEMVKEARDQLLSNETQEEIKQVFEGSCNLIPIKAIAKECISVVDQLIPTLIETLASRMDPTQVCTVAGLCNNGKLESLMKSQLFEIAPILLKLAAGKYDKCSDCQSAMTFVSKILKHIGLDVFTQLSYEACKKEFRGPTIECEAMTKDVIPIVYHYLKSVDPNVFCGAMKSCPLKYQLPKPVGDNLTCEFCEALVQYVRTIFDSNTTKEEFRTAFTNMCKDLREFKSECSSLVNEYFDQFYDFIVKELDPKLACTALGLCGELTQPIKMVKLTPASQIDIFPALRIMKQVNRVGLRVFGSEHIRYEKKPGIEIRPAESYKQTNRMTIVDSDIDTNTIEGEKYHQPQQLPANRYFYPNVIAKNDLVCTVCKKTIDYLKEELKDNRTEQAIRTALDRVCSYLPKELSLECVDFVDEYTDMIVNLLIEEVNPDTICALLKICPAGSSVKAIPIQVPVQEKGVFCEVCVKVMQYVEKELESNSTEEAIREALDKACSYIPDPYGKRCKEFMDKYAEMIFELLSKEVAPRAVCVMIGICPFGEESTGEQNSEIECQICQYTLHYIQDRLMDNATEAEIKQALENACQELPEKFARECKNYIEQYGDAILALLAQEIDPSVICVKLGICPAIKALPEQMQSVIGIKNLKIDTCSTCQIVVDYIDKLLENDDVDRDIVKLVEKVCGVVPMSTRDQCNTIIEAYGPYILQMIGQLADSKEVCQTIDLCARTPGHVHLLGGKKCSFGPAYWCQSSAHAASCKADMYCKLKVWGA